MNTPRNRSQTRAPHRPSRDAGRVRVAIVTESFLPHMNGVTRSVLEILSHLERRGHEATVIAPAAVGLPERIGNARVHGVRSIALPGYRSVRVGAVSVRAVARRLAEFAPDVVHLASPFALGWRGAVAASHLGLPTVAAYQTDVAAYTERYRLTGTASIAEAHVARLHRRATMTLVPSRDSEQQLAGLGVDRLRRWGRGVDTVEFHPRRRWDVWRNQVGAGKTIIGYVGRLAAEKQVDDLRVLLDIPDTRLVVVGDGPARRQLELALPGADFRGHLSGHPLATALASFDVFVHPGESETFGQTLQEAHASGVPVVATGRGGPRDLVRSSVDGWLYRPGDLGDLRARVLDLVGDERKRRAFGAAGRAAVEGRTWERVCDELLGHYADAVRLHAVDAAARARRPRRPELPAQVEEPRAWRRYVALGDSLTEGLCDPAPDGTLRGWADRLALLLAARGEVRYANLAVRSRRIADVAGDQLELARRLKPDLVSVLVGANDLLGLRADVPALAAEVERTVRTLRQDGCDVLLVTPFLPERRAVRVFQRRFAAYSAELARIAERTDAMLLDTALLADLPSPRHWGEDLVHLGPSGHRMLAYRAGEALGVPDAEALAGLDAEIHRVPEPEHTGWWREHALPWAWRRVRGRRAGDGRTAKHAHYVRLGPAAQAHADA